MTKKPPMMIIMIVIVVIILFTLAHKHHHQTGNTNNSALNINADLASGDTNTEVLRQLSAQLALVKKQNTENEKTLSQMKENSSGLSQDDIKTLRHQIDNIKDENQTQIDSLTQTISDLKENQAEQPQLSIPNNQSDGNNAASLLTLPQQGVITQVPDLQQQLAQTGQSSLTPEKAKNNALAKPTENKPFSNATDPTYQPNQTGNAKLTPWYTIPAISNLANTSLLTALIGEVPSNGQLIQPPFPFEAITGRDDLIAANGIDLPAEISGMKVYGYSIGAGSFLDNLSCARAYVTKVLFVFEDGHYAVFGNQDDPTSSINTNDTLGYLTDSYGNPCISGKFITNAPHVLAALSSAGVIAAGAGAIADAQTTTFSDSSSTSSTVTGNMAKYALGSGVSSSMNKTVDWMLNRIKGTFDVVYIPASKDNKPVKLVINFTKTIAIDKDENGRLLDYGVHDGGGGGISSMGGLD